MDDRFIKYYRNFDGKFIVDRNGKVSIPGRDIIADIKAALDDEDL